MGKITHIQDVQLSALKPYENNAKKHSERQIEALTKSINEFGFLSPCLIDKDYNLITGHGRTTAATRLGMDKVPCVFVEGLTEEQRRAYIIADNKLTELGGWDKEMVASELQTLELLDYQIDVTGFDIGDIEAITLKPLEPYGSERNRTAKAYNLDILHRSELERDFWQMPIITNDGYIPEKMVGFNYAKTSKEKDACVHFFLDDYQFERIWNYPEKYVEVLSEYDCILSPDFSLYMNMPMPMKIWNTYRSRQIGSYYQRYGLKVIPTISWAERDTFEFCFRGIEKGSIVCVSTIGVKQDEDAYNVWREGMDEMIRQIEPQTILVYGGELEYDYKGIDVKYYENNVLKRWKEA